MRAFRRSCLDHAIDLVITALLLLCGLVLSAAGAVDVFLQGAMRHAGIDGAHQPLILIVVALLIVIALLRSLGGVFSGLILILLVLMLLRWALPGLQMPPPSSVPGWQPSGAVNM